MKRIGVVLALCVLAGCGSYQTLEELEYQASLTGDWSAVEARERTIERRKRRSGPTCPPGLVSYCDVFGSAKRCTCLNDDAMREALDGWN